MARVRSPNFPIFGLARAIDRARAIFEKEQQLAAPREVLAKHLGYSGYNGKSAKVLSALGKYGLLETAKGGTTFRLSDRAMRILFPKSEADKQAAINEAALGPAIFREINGEWEGGSPSDESLANYLLRNGYSQAAVSPVIAAYRETMSLVTRNQEQYDRDADDLTEEVEAEDDMELARTPPARQGLGATPPPLVAGEPFKVSFVKGGIQGSFDIRNKDDLKAFTAGLEALAALIPEAPKDA